MTHRYASLSEKPYQSGYLFAETTLEHPVRKVWPYVLNIGNWMSEHRLETVAGEPGKVGHFERVHPHGLDSNVGEPHHHVYGIAHIVPYKYIGLEVLPEKGGSYGIKREWMSFDGVLLVDLGRATRVIFLVVDVHMGSGEKDFMQLALESEGGTRIEQYFANLRTQVNDAIAPASRAAET